MIEALAFSENTEELLRKAIKESNTYRFFGWMEVAWPNVRPLLASLADHIECERYEEGQVVFQAVLKATRKAVMQPPKSIVLDLKRADREYLILLYRGFLTSSASELGRIKLGRGKKKWNPLEQSLKSWMRKNESIRAPQFNGAPIRKPTAAQIESLSECILNRTDRRILGKEIERIYEPYPFK